MGRYRYIGWREREESERETEAETETHREREDRGSTRCGVEWGAPQ